MFCRPSLGLAEIAWRWSFGTAAALLLTALFFEYFDTLPVSRGDLFLLRMRHPLLVSQAISHIFQGSAPRFVLALLVLGAGISMLWIWIASLGRWTTLRSLASYFREQNQELGDLPSGQGQIRAIAGLNFFRAAAALAAMVGFVGAMLLGGAVSPDKDPSPGAATLVFLMVIIFVAAAWGAVNWCLSLAPLFVVAEGCDTFGAMAATMRFFREHLGPVAATSTWFGLAHLVLLSVASSVVAFPLAFISVLPVGVVLGGVLLIALLYFALVDYLYMGRLAAYLCIVEGPGLLPVAVTAGEPPAGNLYSGVQPDGRVDQDELILCDVPLEPKTAQ